MGRGRGVIKATSDWLRTSANWNQGKRGRGGRGGRGGGAQRDNRDNRVSFDAIVKNNEKFERYYNTLLSIPEDEKPVFWDALRRELPNSFRFAGSKGYCV
jgi:multisite-specific tRNA:(cytosine-C5)-methyltransferase